MDNNNFGNIILDHIGIAVNDLDEGEIFWKLLGLTNVDDDFTIEEQGVMTRFYCTDSNEEGAPKIELLKSLYDESPIAKFIQKRGVGIQQVCFRVENLDAMIAHLLDNGIQMVDEVAKIGARNTKIAFVHPNSTGGVLVELAQMLES